MLFKRFTKKIDDRFFYQAIGNEKGVYTLVNNFYEVMETNPKAIDCLRTHELDNKGKVPDEVKKKLFMFLCGWFGGPQLFIETYGQPKMAERHGHVKINSKVKEEWIYCINRALKKHPYKMTKSERKKMLNSFNALAGRIQNS